MGPCAKRVVTATLVAANGQRVVGRNDCATPVNFCPRTELGFSRGEGYVLCYSVCRQQHHAEAAALVAAAERGIPREGGVLYVEGIDHICGACASLARYTGTEVVLGSPPEARQ
jgi:deoxycytidylate deaminase